MVVEIVCHLPLLSLGDLVMNHLLQRKCIYIYTSCGNAVKQVVVQFYIMHALLGLIFPFLILTFLSRQENRHHATHGKYPFSLFIFFLVFG